MKRKFFYLINKHSGEIVDACAVSLVDAKCNASEVLGGKPSDYIERF